MSLDTVYPTGDEFDPSDEIGVSGRTDHDGSLSSHIGDVLFNKSLLRQLIDLELLLLTGFTWVFFLGTELAYHRWKEGKGQTTQYSFAGGVGEGIFTKIGKFLFVMQFVLVAGIIFLIIA